MWERMSKDLESTEYQNFAVAESTNATVRI